jgi:hypothetical protein
MAKKPANPYKLVKRTPDAPKEKPSTEKQWPHPGIHPGDLVTVHYKPLHFHIPNPTRVTRVEPSKYGLEGWVAWVETDKGEKMLTATYLKKYNPAPERGA